MLTQQRKPFVLLLLFLALLLVLLTACTVEGTRFVDEAAAPIAGETLTVLCYESDALEGGTFMGIEEVTTDADGRATLPQNCNYVAALRPRHEQPSGKADHGPAYRVYDASWPRGAAQLSSAGEDVVIADSLSGERGQPLVVFDVVASLAWQPEPNSPFLAELEDGFRRASAYLYDLTEGQMAFGNVSVFVDGERWENADFRFLAANDQRPAAFVGGIVNERINYPLAERGVEATYKPAAMLYGRYWDGNSANQGAWNQEDGFRTLVHEWAHYALFLYDEYYGPVAQRTYCTCVASTQTGTFPGASCTLTSGDSSSAMYYHYEASEFWLGASGARPPEMCRETQQYFVHSMSDWETLAKWTEIQGLSSVGALLYAPASTSPGTSPLAGHLVTFSGGAGGSATAEPTLTVAADAPGEQTTTYVAQVYTLEDATRGAEIPAQIRYQGSVLATGPRDEREPLGDLTLLGVRQGDRLHVSVDVYDDAGGGAVGRYVLPADPLSAPALPLTDSDVVALTDTWRPALDAEYEMTPGPTGDALLTGMTLTLESPDPLEEAPIAHLCSPDSAIACGRSEWQQTMTPVGDDGPTWQAQFKNLPESAEFPLYWIARVYAPGMGEIIRWIRDNGGVGPIHEPADAPLRDGDVAVDLANPEDDVTNGTACSRVIVMPTATYAEAAPPGVTLLTPPLDFDFLLDDGSGTCTNYGGNEDLPLAVTLTFFYDPRTLDAEGGRVQIARYDGDRWEPVDRDQDYAQVEKGQQQDQRAPDLALASSQPLTQAGTYALIAVSP